MKKYMTPARVIALGFLAAILFGALLLYLPISQKNQNGITFTDALFTSTSAVCVTGLSTFDAGSTLTVFGQVVLMLLIQFGGLGFASISVGLAVITGQKLFTKQRTLLKEAMNYNSLGGIISLLKSVFITTFIIEGIGALLSFCVFIKDYSFVKAVWLGIFHSVSAFNNAGFDVLGFGNSLVSYSDNIPLNLITTSLIILGGIGFLVIKEILFKKRNKRFSLHTKVVLTVTFFLLISGTVLFKLSESYTWLEAFFMSTSTRTAGFTTVDLSKLSNAGAIIMVFFMFIGASPTSTGGGIKTTTFLIILMALYSHIASKKCSLFKRTISKELLHKAFIVMTLSLGVVLLSLFSLSLAEPSIPIKDLMLETVSATGTVGLSTGITPALSALGKYIIIITMYIGRLGPLTVLSLWTYKKQSSVSYAEESLTLG